MWYLFQILYLSLVLAAAAGTSSRPRTFKRVCILFFFIIIFTSGVLQFKQLNNCLFIFFFYLFAYALFNFTCDLKCLCMSTVVCLELFFGGGVEILYSLVALYYSVCRIVAKWRILVSGSRAGCHKLYCNYFYFLQWNAPHIFFK